MHSKRIEALRQVKKELRKSRKLLHKNGQQGSAADALISKRWFAVMHEHNRLTRASREREAAIHNFHQQKKFKQNPMQFGKELFQKKCVGQPAFSSEVAVDYFAKLYRDEKRDHSFLPLPEMKRPPLPQHPLLENPPQNKKLRKCCV